MLCQKCETAIKAYFSKGQDQCATRARLHSSLPSFYQSLKDGCTVCRIIWARILKGEGPHTSSAIFLDDLSQQIPFELQQLRDKSAELVDLKRGSSGASYSDRDDFRDNFHEFAHHDDYSSFCGEEHDNIYGMWIFMGIIWHMDFVTDIGKRPYGIRVAINGKDWWTTPIELHPVTPETSKFLDTVYKKRETPPATTADTADLWRHWFTTCAEKHTVCRAAEQRLKKRNEQFRPTRLVQLLPHDGASFGWKLDCRSATGTTDTISTPRYLTLSHCWGPPELSESFKLKKERHHRYLERSLVDILPKSYQDAFVVARSLDFSYIWVDSLCITQDDEQDWKEQSAMMGNIYSYAACNIAASWASDNTKGCFNTSDMVTKSLTLIALQIPGQDQLTQYQIGQTRSYANEIEQAPLNKRGWVVQETYLARRQLNFAKCQVFWECHQLVASEEFPTGLPLREISSSKCKRNLECKGRRDMRDTWADLVGLYSNCGLTKKSDKLVAISGLANELVRTTNDQYIYGLWKNDLYLQLCWKTHDYKDKNIDQTTIPRGIAPTWSWANIDGRAKYDAAYTNHKMYARASKLGVIPWMQLQQHVTGKLILRGVAMWGCPKISPGHSHGPDHREEYVEVQLHNKTGTQCSQSLVSTNIRLLICWDKHLALSNGDSSELSILQTERSSALLFFVVRGVGLWEEGLVLRSEGVEYVRMGVWSGNMLSLLSVVSVNLMTAFNSSMMGGFRVEERLNDHRIQDCVYTVTII
ncbi:heterokaryon incompatibility protein-domain-containing protein [Xylaria telfairii]|nr:heterokaryon incompatibility protein-domain-containing protein [Xylaria telfairii]